MRRQARPAPFARMRLEPHLRELANLPTADWPRHLQMARLILVYELKLPDETAWAILQSSLAVAHACAQQMDRGALGVFQSRHRDRLAKIFARMAKCAKRLPASPRHALDGEVRAHLRQTPIDSERIETLIETLTTGFGKWPKAEPPLTVLRAVMPGPSSPETLKETDAAGIHRAFAEAATILQADYAALPALDQRHVESTLTALPGKTEKDADTTDVCMALSRVLVSTGKHRISSAAADIITTYVKSVGEIWTKHGLRPGRATRRWDSSYRSRFHRFAELILTDAVEPWSKRHDGNESERLARLRESHAAPPKQIRGSVRPSLRRADVEWLISEDHVKRALAGAQKKTPKTP